MKAMEKTKTYFFEKKLRKIALFAAIVNVNKIYIVAAVSC